MIVDTNIIDSEILRIPATVNSIDLRRYVGSGVLSIRSIYPRCYILRLTNNRINVNIQSFAYSSDRIPCSIAVDKNESLKIEISGSESEFVELEIYKLQQNQRIAECNNAQYRYSNYRLEYWPISLESGQKFEKKLDLDSLSIVHVSIVCREFARWVIGSNPPIQLFPGSHDRSTRFEFEFSESKIIKFISESESTAQIYVAVEIYGGISLINEFNQLISKNLAFREIPLDHLSIPIESIDLSQPLTGFPYLPTAGVLIDRPSSISTVFAQNNSYNPVVVYKNQRSVALMTAFNIAAIELNELLYIGDELRAVSWLAPTEGAKQLYIWMEVEEE